MNGPPPSSSRRRVVAGIGSAGLAALSGCSDLLDTDRSDPSYDRSVLRETAALGTPTSPDRVPVPITEAYVESGRDRTESLLAVAEETIADLPEGPPRRYASERAERARDDVAESRDQPTPYEAVQSVRVARGYAAEARATALAAASDLTRESVLEDRQPIRERLAAFRGRLRYLGGPASLSVLTFRYVERLSHGAARALDQAGGSPGNRDFEAALVGATAGRVEAARTFLDDASHLYTRHRETSDDAPLRGVYEDALAPLAGEARHRFDALPPTLDERPVTVLSRPLRGTSVADAVRHLYRRADVYTRSATGTLSDEEQGPGTRLVDTALAYQVVVALTRLLDAAETGEVDPLDSAAQLRATKTDLVRAVSTARDGTHPFLTDHLLADPVGVARATDDHLGRELEGGSEPDVEAHHTRYLRAAALAAAVPEAVDTVAGGIEAAASEEV